MFSSELCFPSPERNSGLKNETDGLFALLENGKGTGTGNGTGAMGPKKLCRNVHTGPRQGRKS